MAGTSTGTDWIQTIAVIYFAWQQNRIFKRQNEIFANQAGQTAAQKNTSPLLKLLERYWPTLIMVALMALTGYDIYSRHANEAATPNAASIPWWWQYSPLLLFVAAGVGLVVGKLAGVKTKPPEPKKLTIRSAFYGTGTLDERDVTDKLSAATTDALVVPVDNNFLGCDPAPMKPKRLRVEYSYGNLSILQATRWEGGRLLLPEDSEIQRLTSEIRQLKSSQPAQSQYPIPQLRLKVAAMCSELQGFLGQHGQEPKVERQTQESEVEFSQRWRNIVMPWRAKFLGDFRLKFGDSVPRLQDEIRVRAGIDDFVLNNLITKAANDPNGNVKAVEDLTRRLWDLALGINA
jgi:hypothetical protein